MKDVKKNGTLLKRDGYKLTKTILDMTRQELIEELIGSFEYDYLVENNFVAEKTGLIIAGIFYFRNVFRLYQIRHRELCKPHHFLSKVCRSFKEIFPLVLPESWKAFDENKDDLKSMKTQISC